MNHRRTSSDSSTGRLLPNYNLPNIDGEDDGMDMSPLKRLQRLKQNGSLRLVPKGRCSKRTLNFPPDVQNYSGSDTSLSDRDGKVPSTNSSRSDVSVGNCADLEKQTKSCVKVSNGKDVKDNKNVHFKDDIEDKNGNNSKFSEKELKDANGNLSIKIPPEVDSQTTESSEFNEKKLNVPSIVETVAESEAQTSVTSKEETNDVDSETGEVKLSNSGKGGPSQLECSCTKRVKPPVPAKRSNLSRIKAKAPNVPQSESDNSSRQSSQGSDKPKSVTVISAQSNNGDANHKKDKQNIVTVQYSPIAKPVIEVKLIQRQTRSQTPSPLSLRHSTDKGDNVVIRTRNRSQSNPQDDKWLSRSVDELDKSADIYACPTSFLRETDVKLRHSFIDRGFTEKERQAIYNSVGDVQTLLRNSFVCEDEKIYSLPQPACYGDNTLKAVKKITEKYDTLQRRKLRALSFREGAKYSGPGASFSQPSSPVSPTGLSGVQPPPPPSSPPPPLSAGASSVCSSVFDSPDGHSTPIAPRSPIPPPPPPRSTPSPSEEIPASSTGVTLKDTARLDLFYRGRGTEVVVCKCLADLRFGTAIHSGSEEVSDWTPVINIGVPLLVLNTGKGKRRRDLLVTIAERETGFPLWFDKINYLSNYRQTDPTIHVMKLSNNLKKVAGLTFHCETAAKEFLDRFQEITKDPNDDLWKVSSGSTPHDNKKKKRPFSFRRLKLKKASKNDISLPCNFSHITSVDPQDRVLYEDLQNVPKLSRSLPSSPTSSRPSSIANS